MYEVKCAKCMTPQLASAGQCSVCGATLNQDHGADSPRSSIFDHVEKPVSKPIFFPVSVTKFVVMHVATFGLYYIFWAYKSWLYYQSCGNRVRPGWRTFLSVIYLNALLEEILNAGVAIGLSKTYAPKVVFGTWLGLQISSRLPDPFWLISFFTFVPLIPVLKYVNEINRATGKADAINSKFSIINYIGIAVGAICLLIVFWGAMMPDT